jgi:hypothetical protein
MKQLAPFIALIGILTIIAVVIVTLLNHRLKKKILDAGPLNEQSLRLLSRITSPGSEALKWGLIFFFGGLGLVVLEFIPFDAEHSSLPYGLETIFIALGILLYYAIERKKQD